MIDALYRPWKRGIRDRTPLCLFGEAAIGHLDVVQDFPGLKLHGE